MRFSASRSAPLWLLALCCGLLLALALCLQGERASFSALLRALSAYDARFPRRVLGDAEALIFIGGMPRSGTTLMRAMLDAHERIRCGEETMVIPWILNERREWAKRKGITEGSGLSEKVLDDAVSAFISEIITKHGAMADRLCNKDPFALLYTTQLRQYYPNAKFILMLRDPRATVHSIITREVPVYGFNRTNFKQCFVAWNVNMRKLVSECRGADSSCLTVRYESLVQSPRAQMRRVLAFLAEPWSDRVLQHEKFIGDEVMLNPHEFSTNQVVQAVNLRALTAWKGFFDDDVLSSVPKLAPMMASLGYDPFDFDPDYSNWIIPEETM